MLEKNWRTFKRTPKQKNIKNFETPWKTNFYLKVFKGFLNCLQNSFRDMEAKKFKYY